MENAKISDKLPEMPKGRRAAPLSNISQKHCSHQHTQASDNRNGNEWFGVHRFVMEGSASHVKRLRRRSPSRSTGNWEDWNPTLHRKFDPPYLHSIGPGRPQAVRHRRPLKSRLVGQLARGAVFLRCLIPRAEVDCGVGLQRFPKRWSPSKETRSGRLGS